MKITFSQARKRRDERIEYIKNLLMISAFVAVGIYTFVLNQEIYEQNTDYVTLLVDASK